MVRIFQNFRKTSMFNVLTAYSGGQSFAVKLNSGTNWVHCFVYDNFTEAKI